MSKQLDPLSPRPHFCGTTLCPEPPRSERAERILPLLGGEGWGERPSALAQRSADFQSAVSQAFQPAALANARARTKNQGPHASTALSTLAILLAFCFSSNAALYQNPFDSSNATFANSGNIPDGTTTGWSDTRTLSIADNSIVSISVKLNVTGGYNGDLYAYLSHDGVLVPLINRVGVGSSGAGGTAFGYGDAGFNVTLSSSATDNIHFYGQHSPTITAGQLTGDWKPDGRLIDPNSPRTSFDAGGTITFDAYQNLDPNGNWTLFFADMSGGGGISHLVSYELDITAIPEPVNVALVIFGICATSWAAVRRLRLINSIDQETTEVL